MPIINGDELRDAPAKLNVPPGVYTVVVDGVPEAKQNKKQDGDNLHLIMSIINNPEHEGKKLFEYLPLSGSAKSKPFRDARLHHVLKCFGFDLTGQINTDDLAGKVGMLTVKEEISEDQNTKVKTIRSTIDQFLPAGADPGTGGSPSGSPTGTPPTNNLDSVLGSVES
jgi:hypothetical protein